MRALRLLAPGKLELVEIPEPEPGPDQVLIRTGASTICGSDLADIRANPFAIPLPVVLGHEAAGVVATVGRDVRGLRAGDRVAAHPVHPCGTCAECARGLCHLCPRLSHFGIDLQGTFADAFVARQDRVRPIPDGVDFATAALAEPVCVCLEAVRRSRVGAGDGLLVIGDGPFGILMARLAARSGVRVTIAGHHPFRLALAAPATGIDVRGQERPDEALLAANGGLFDAAILAVPRPEAVALGLRLLRPRGRLVVFAPIPGETPLPLTDLLMGEREILGAVNDEDLFDEAVGLLADPALNLHDLVTHRLPLDAYVDALALAEHGRAEAVKVAFTWP